MALQAYLVVETRMGAQKEGRKDMAFILHPDFTECDKEQRNTREDSQLNLFG